MGIGIELLEVLVLLSALVAMLARRLHVPYSVGLVVAGTSFGLLYWGNTVPLSQAFLFKVLLPPLVFDAAFHLVWRDLRKDIAVVLTLAAVGPVLSGGATAIGMHWLAHWEWLSALLFGALIAATDPVSVIAALKEAGVTGRARLLLEAESLFNDGTAAVAFSLLLACAGLVGPAPADVANSALLIVGGSVFCGILVGGLALSMIARSADHLVETTFAMIAAYGSFLLAEDLHVSGVLATLTAGLLMGNLPGTGVLSAKGRIGVEATLEYVSFLANSLIFLFIGIQEAHRGFALMLATVACALLMVTIGRALAVYLCCAAFRRSSLRVPLATQHLLFWGGLRGALALALAVNLPAGIPHREEIVTATFAVVAFSIFVQGLTIKPLIRRLAL